MAEANEIIAREVTSWPGIIFGPHRFGGNEFLLGRAEIGHLHGSRLLDAAFSKAVRDVLIAEGKVSPHHVAPETGWISFWLRKPEDTAHAIWLLRLSYLRHVLLLRRKPHGGEAVAGVDVTQALRDLDPSNDLQSVFDQLLARQA